MKKRYRATPAEVEAQRLAVISLLRRNLLLSDAEAARITGISAQRIGQFAATDPALAKDRAEEKAKQIAKATKGYPVIKL